MSAYAVTADFTGRFSVQELTDLTGSGVQNAKLDQAIADASQEIDSYLAVRYQLPLSVVPQVLTRVCCDIARYRLWSNAASEEIATRYKQAVQFLTSVSTGIVKLGVTPAPQAGSEDPAPLSSSNPRTFGAGLLADYLDPRAGR